jgi:hypothetical protein
MPASSLSVGKWVQGIQEPNSSQTVRVYRYLQNKYQLPSKSWGTWKWTHHSFSLVLCVESTIVRTPLEGLREFPFTRKRDQGLCRSSWSLAGLLSAHSEIGVEIIRARAEAGEALGNEGEESARTCLGLSIPSLAGPSTPARIVYRKHGFRSTSQGHWFPCGIIISRTWNPLCRR